MKMEEKIDFWTCELIREFERNIDVDLMLMDNLLLILRHEINKSILYIEYVTILTFSFGSGALFGEVFRKQLSMEYFLIQTSGVVMVTMLLLSFIFFKFLNNYIIKSKYKRLLRDFDIKKINPDELAIPFDDIINIKNINYIVLIETKYKTYKLSKVSEDFLKFLSTKIGTR